MAPTLRTFSVTKWKLYAALIATFFGIIALVMLTLMYTPARSLLPVSNSEVEELYGKQIAAIQDQVVTLYREMTRLRGYNLQLRKALGENVSPADSSLVASALRNKEERNQEEILEGKNSQRFAENVNAEPVQQPKFTGLTTFIQQQQSADMAVEATFPMSLPVEGYVSRGFDGGNFHYGIDLVSKVSSPILSAADGAHVPGMMRLNVHELGCDMYSSSPHKWLQAPKGSGFLYVRDEVIDQLWNTIATEGWDDKKIRAERFQRIGSSNVPALWGLRAARGKHKKS